MNREKSNRGVSNMDVLKDIRGLLSVTQEREDVAAGEVKGSSGLEVEVARLETQIRGYKELIQKQQEELSVVKSEKEEFAVRLKVLNDANDQLISPASGSVALGEETAQLEVRIAELSAALSQIESLLKLRIQELLKRMANLFSEAGQGEVAIEFRKAAHGLEVAENFARFLRVFLEQ